MDKKMCIFLGLCLIAWLNSGCTDAYIRRISKPTIIKWNEKIRSRIENITEIRHYTDCGGKITKGPGSIEQLFNSRNPAYNVHCQWKIRAPENNQVYVKQLRITRTTLQNAQTNKFDDAPFIRIFDGNEANDVNLLYRFGDVNLNRCLSSERELIVDLTYNELGKHIDYEAVVKYGFIEDHLVEDLIP